MTREELSAHAKRLAQMIQSTSGDYHLFITANAQACEFLRKFAGPKSTFLGLAESATRGGIASGPLQSSQTLLSFADYVDSGLLEEISPERRAQLDVVSDLLEQAQSLLDNRSVHPAAPAMLIGATLEEFLRTWVESRALPLGSRKPGIDTYSQLLREADLITKQDAKDITSWAGIRNYAAHGEWDSVGTKANISLMLQGVNLFLRRYESGKGT